MPSWDNDSVHGPRAGQRRSQRRACARSVSGTLGVVMVLCALPIPRAAAQDFDSEFDAPAAPSAPPPEEAPEDPRSRPEVRRQPSDSEPPPRTLDPDGSLTLPERAPHDAPAPRATHGVAADIALSQRDESAESAATNDAPARSETRAPVSAELHNFQLHNSIFGATGGVHVIDARPARADSFRVQLVTKYFSTSDFLVAGDSHEFVGGTLAMSWGLLPWLEIFGSLDSTSNSNDRESPRLIQVLGDLRVGGKVGFGLFPWLFLGGDASLFVPTSAELDPGFSAVGGQFSANATADFRNYADQPLPLITRVQVGYVLDNSAALTENVETRRFTNLVNPDLPGTETRHLLTAVERYGYGVNRTDFLRIAVGLEAPFEPIEHLVVAPLVEYTVGVPVNRQGFDCPFIPAFPGASRPRAGEEGCLAVQGLAAIPMDVTLGVRVLPPVPGLALLLAADIGLTGTDPDDQVRDISGNAPWTLYLGAGFAFDLRSQSPALSRTVVEAEEAGRPPEAVRIVGHVVDEETGVPVPNARIHYIASGLSDQLASADGTFQSTPLDPGSTVTLEITALDYEPGQCDVSLPEVPGDVPVTCRLAAVATVVVEEGEVVVLEKINFAFDSDEILGTSFGLLDSIARTLQRHPDLTHIEIQGHTDDQGSAAYNQDLSERRASSVMRALLARGVDAGRLTSRGFGLERPLVPNDSEAHRSTNRRVQFIILGRDSVESGVDGGVQPAPKPG